MKQYEKTIIQLTEDFHGFPTYAVHHRHTRYNFCHLTDVFGFLRKVYNVDNDELLVKQRRPKGEAANTLVKTAKRVLYHELRDFLLSLVESHGTITFTEVFEYVNVEFGQRYTNRQVVNSLGYLMLKKKVASAGRGKYTKVRVDGVSRKLPADGGTGTTQEPT